MHLKTLNCIKFLAPLALAILSVTVGISQNVNNWRAGGSLFLQLSSASSKDSGNAVPGSKNSTFTFSPFAGYDFTKNWEAGLSVSVSTATTKEPGTETSSKHSDNTYYVGPYARYYWHCEKLPWLSPVIQGYAGVGFGTDKNTITTGGNTTTNKTNLFIFRTTFSPGLSFYICNNVSLETFIGALTYDNTTYKPKEDPSFKSHTSSFGLSWSNNFGFGLSFRF